MSVEAQVKCKSCGQWWSEHPGCELLCAENKQLRTIVEIIQTQHWDMAACPCWICRMGREAGCHPREEHLKWRGTYAFAKMEDR